jgi:hypothetical protein
MSKFDPFLYRSIELTSFIDIQEIKFNAFVENAIKFEVLKKVEALSNIFSILMLLLLVRY